MKKITLTEFKKKYFKGCKEYTISAYDSKEKHMLKVLVVSKKVNEITVVHSQGSKKPFCIIVPSLELSKEDQRSLIHYVGVMAYATIRDLKTNERIKTIDYKPERIVSEVETAEFDRIMALNDQSKVLQDDSNERAKAMLDDYTIDQIKEMAREWPEFIKAKTLSSEYRKEFEKFIKVYGYNPYDYDLIVEKVPAAAV